MRALATGRNLVFAAVVTAGCGGSSIRRTGEQGEAGSPSEGGTGARGGTPTSGGSGTTGGASGNATGGSGGVPDPEPPLAPCVTAAVDLEMPVGVTGYRQNDYEIVALDDAVAVVRHRFASTTAIRTYALDGTPIAEEDVADDSRLIRTVSGQLLLLTHDGGMLVARIGNATLDIESVPLLTPANETEKLTAGMWNDAGLFVLTTERFMHVSTEDEAGWPLILAGEAGAEPPSADDRMIGMGSSGDRILVAYGHGETLRRLLLTLSGELVDYASNDDVIAYQERENSLAIPFGEGLVMVGGNVVTVTRMGFDMSLEELGSVDNIQPFYRNTPSLALAPYGDRLLGVWFAPTPLSGSNLNQVYACELDLSGIGPTCAQYSVIAEVDFNQYLLSYQPIAAAVTGNTLAVVHADMSERTWLRFVDLECALGAGGQ
jgi:hypothetical protein